MAENDNSFFSFSGPTGADIALGDKFGPELFEDAPAPDPNAMPTYDIDIKGYINESAEIHDSDRDQATRRLARDLILRAERDPNMQAWQESQGKNIDWRDMLRKSNPNDIIRMLVTNVRQDEEGFADEVELAASELTKGLTRGGFSLYGGAKGAAALAPFGAPAGPLGVFGMGALGFIGGSTGGYLLGDLLVEGVELADPNKDQQLAPDDMFLADFAKTSGEFLPGLGLRTFAKEGGDWVADQTLKSLMIKKEALKDTKGFAARGAKILNGTQRASAATLKFMQRVNDNLAKNNKKLSDYTGDVASAELAAFAGAVAESWNPGDPYWRITGEISGGLAPALLPSQYIMKAGKNIGDATVGAYKRRFTEAGRRQSVAEELVEKAAQEKMEGLGGVDPESRVVTQQRLNEAFELLDAEIAKFEAIASGAKERGEVVPTLAQVTDIDYLKTITQAVAENNSLLTGQAKASADSVIEKNVELLRALFRASKVDPNAARLYMELQEEFYGNMLDSLLTQEAMKLQAKIDAQRAKIPLDEEGDIMTKGATGEEVGALFEKLSKIVGKQEDELWRQIDPQNEVILDATTLVETFKALGTQGVRGGIARGEKFGPPEMMETVEGIINNPGGAALTGEAATALQTARKSLGNFQVALEKIIEKNPRAQRQYTEALEELQFISPEGNRHLRTMNLQLAPFDESASEAAQVAEYLTKRLAALGTKGTDPGTRRALQDALKIAETKVQMKNTADEIAQATPEGIPANPISLGELSVYRSVLSRIARTKAPSPTEAGMVGRAKKLVQAIDEDLKASGVSTDAYNTARAFTKVKNDRFKRSFIGRILGTKSTGEEALDPEKITKNMLAAEEIEVAKNMADARRAINFLNDQLGEGFEVITQSSLNTLQAQEEAFMRLALISSLDDETGTVTARSINSFLNRPAVQVVLKAHPSLAADFRDVRSAARALEGASAKVSESQSVKDAQDMQAFMQAYIGRKDGPTALDEYIGVPGPEKRPDDAANNLRKLIRLMTERNKEVEGAAEKIKLAEEGVAKARRKVDSATNRKEQAIAEEDLAAAEAQLDAQRRIAMDVPDEPVSVSVMGPDGAQQVTKPPAASRDILNGFKKTVLERAFIHATNDEGKFSVNKFNNYLFQPISAGEQSVAAIMRKAGLFTDEELTTIKNNIQNIKQYSDTTAKFLGETPELIDPLSDGLTALTRGFGARLGQKFFGMGQSPVGGLQAESIGAQLANRVFNLIPSQKRRELFVQAATDPEVAAKLMKEVRNAVKASMIKDLDKKATARERAAEGFVNFLAATVGIRLTGPTVREALREAFEDLAKGQLASEETPAPAPAEPVESFIENQAPPTIRAPESAPAPAPTPAPAIDPSKIDYEKFRQFRRQPFQAPSASPQAQVNTRQRMSQLFPNDPILGANSGIGSLIG